MANLSLNERLEIIVDAIKNNDIAKYVIPAILVLGLILILFAKSKNKFSKILTIILSLGLIGTGIYFFANPILNFLDYLVEVVVNNILFPNIAVYISTILIVDLALIISILSNNMPSYMKRMNVLVFVLMQILLFFIVENVIKNQVDVYEMLSVYTNQELLVLIEGSMIIFALWVVLHLIIKIVRSIPVKEKMVVENKNVVNELNNKVVLDFNEISNDFDDFNEFVPIKKKRV